jgi:hypothetical protein
MIKPVSTPPIKRLRLFALTRPNRPDLPIIPDSILDRDRLVDKLCNLAAHAAQELVMCNRTITLLTAENERLRIELDGLKAAQLQ